MQQLLLEQELLMDWIWLVEVWSTQGKPLKYLSFYRIWPWCWSDASLLPHFSSFSIISLGPNTDYVAIGPTWLGPWDGRAERENLTLKINVVLFRWSCEEELVGGLGQASEAVTSSPHPRNVSLSQFQGDSHRCWFLPTFNIAAFSFDSCKLTLKNWEW